MNTQTFVDWFRQASPYINAHRAKTFVICFGGEAVADEDHFSSLIHDIALLNSLGARLILVHGARPQIEQRLTQSGLQQNYINDLRITDEQTLAYVKEAVGSVRIRIEASLSMGLANSPMHGARIRVASGNFVTARPLGVHDGVDYGFTGTVRRIDNIALRHWLNNNAIILLSSLGYSPSGEAFNINAEEVATEVAASLRADKLLFLYEGADLVDENDDLIREMGPGDAEHLLKQQPDLDSEIRRHLQQALRSCQAGVRRVHLVKRQLNGGLILELFTRDGVGTMIAGDLYDDLRQANIDDVGGLLELLQPLEQAGVLVRRSRELLETEIDYFVVLERDGAIIGCAALYPFADEGIGELACVAIAPEYRNGGRADALLRYIEKNARRQRLKQLFVLTTQTAHWFLERGFEPALLDNLPVQKQELYNWQRRSKVFVKTL